MVEITYALSEKGQKVNLLAGGKGGKFQKLTVKHGEPEYVQAVELAKVSGDGTATLYLHASQPQGESGVYRSREYDTPPTVAELLAHESERQEWVRRREEEREQKVLAELLADVPASLLHHSYNYGWRVKDEAEKRADAIGNGLVAKAREEADRRNSEESAACERAKAEQKAELARREKAKEESLTKRQAEMEEWAELYGSERLNRCVAEGIECFSIYRDERLALEYPGWERDGGHLPSWDDPRNPPAEALDLLDEARRNLPVGWTDERRNLASLVYWSKCDGDGETCTGYAVTLCPGDWCGDLVYGYDGPRDEE